MPVYLLMKKENLQNRAKARILEEIYRLCPRKPATKMRNKVQR